MAPVQFKGEIMDFDIGMEIDHRKRYDEVFTFGRRIADQQTYVGDATGPLNLA